MLNEEARIEGITTVCGRYGNILRVRLVFLSTFCPGFKHYFDLWVACLEHHEVCSDLTSCSFLPLNLS